MNDILIKEQYNILQESSSPHKAYDEYGDPLCYVLICSHVMTELIILG